MNALQRRLQTYRERATAYGRPWQEVRYPSTLPFGTTFTGTGPKGQRYTEQTDTYGTIVLTCDDRTRSSRSDNTGWYADSFQDSLVKYGVARISTPKGRLYVPVTWNTDSVGATYHFADRILVPKNDPVHKDSYDSESTHSEAIQDVMRYADSCAEYEAEECREYAAKDAAEQRIESLNEEIDDAKDSIRAIRTEVRANAVANAPAVCRIDSLPCTFKERG